MTALFALVFTLIIPIAKCSKIVFPSVHVATNTPCRLELYNKIGKCVLPQDCKLYDILKEHSRFSEILCHDRNAKLICCPEILGANPVELFHISRPSSTYEGCGVTYSPSFTESLPNFYSTNRSAETLEEEGFIITEHRMFEDQLLNFRFSNSTYNTTYFPDHQVTAEGIGGLDARRVVTIYMAILGVTNRLSGSVDWLCDGVLINFDWVLTAAHCFKADLDTVRLGEYSLLTGKSNTEDPQDYGINQVVLYPKYKFPAVYHDLALVKLSRTTYIARKDINPICLPWGKETQIDLRNTQITLTGWGATFFGGPISNIPQEINVTVFEVEKCEMGYSTLRDYKIKFPEGMNTYPILCAGDEAGGKDACQGDSGAPVVYLNGNGRYTLAGIVSAGHGCGLKEFPGIYTPIAIPEYLKWIKATAFTPDIL